jgi:rod shape-determining protein MreD
MWFLGRLNDGLWALVPFILTVLLVLGGIARWPLPDPISIPPEFGLIAVFYWGLHRPAVFPLVAVFAIGLVQDLLGGDPIGLNALVYLFAYTVIRNRRDFFDHKSFMIEWGGFLVMAAAAGCAVWLVMSALAGSFIEPAPAIARFVLNCAIYPILAWIFGMIRRGMTG